MAPLNHTVHVALGDRAYDIHIGSGTLATVGAQLQELFDVTHCVVITDSNVRPLYGEKLIRGLADESVRVDVLEVPAGEPSKCVAKADELWNKLLACHADRHTLVIALGGGVVGDLAGFVAASFARGIRFVQVPSTLLAQVDSSVGGKVGINLPGAKNMVGAFWQPLGVWIDTSLLGSLPDREYFAGMAEVVKHGVILDEELFVYIENNLKLINDRDPATLGELVSRCCRIKASVVEADERETTGLRAVLNYGHTFAHAFEATAGYGQILHGEAVSIGMLCASRLAERIGLVDAGFTARQQQVLKKLNLPVDLPNTDVQALLDAMASDKKTEHGHLRFVLPRRMGQVEIVTDVNMEDARAVMCE